MNMTDPIADMLTRIRNGYQAKMTTVDVAPYSKVKAEIAKILKSEGYSPRLRKGRPAAESSEWSGCCHHLHI